MVIIALKSVLLRNLWEMNIMKNEILQELWKINDQVAIECDYDIEKLAKKLRAKEKKSKVSIVDLTTKMQIHKKNKKAL